MSYADIRGISCSKRSKSLISKTSASNGLYKTEKIIRRPIPFGLKPTKSNNKPTGRPAAVGVELIKC